MMFRDLIGVVERGAPWALETPRCTAKTLDLSVGRSYIIRLRLIDEAGAPVITGPGEQLTFAAKRSSAFGEQPIITIPAAPWPADGPGGYRFGVVPGDTANQCAGNYVYEITLDTSAGVVSVVPLSRLFLSPSLR